MTKWKTLWQKEKLLVLINFFCCHYAFKKLSAADSVYMRERVNNFIESDKFNFWLIKLNLI